MSKGSPGGEFLRLSAEEEFMAYATRELDRRRHSDRDFDENLARRAVDLVITRLKRRREGDA